MRNHDRETTFKFKQFEIINRSSAMKVSTDGVLLGAWANAYNAKHILDVGAATGLIAIMMAQRCPDASIEGIELDEVAADEGRANMKASSWADRLQMHTGDFMLFNGHDYDCIISNPPFFTEKLQSPDAARALARHGDSLNVATLIRKSVEMLTDDGSLIFIAPYSLNDSILYELTMVSLVAVRTCDVITTEGKQPTRRLWHTVRRNHAQSMSMQRQTLTIKDKSGIYTELYRTLTNDFYTHLK